MLEKQHALTHAPKNGKIESETKEYMANHLDVHKEDFEKAVEHFNKELQGIRTGRANAGFVEGVRVSVYGQEMALKAIASITIPDAKTIQIEPWDKSAVKEIEKGLMESNLGMTPNTQGTVIRLVMPLMTEENRKNMVKLLGQKEEQARIQVRNTREKIRSAILDDEKNKVVNEDEKHRQLEALDKETLRWNTKLDEMTKEKEDEILKI